MDGGAFVIIRAVETIFKGRISQISDSVRCRAAVWQPTDLEQVSGFWGSWL